MATAGGEISEVASETPAEGSDSERAPIMPHLDHSSTELDRLYPSIEPPDDDKLDDLADDRADGIYQEGLRISEEIVAETNAQGRRRRPTTAALQRLTRDASSNPTRRSRAAAHTHARRGTATDNTDRACRGATTDNSVQAPRGLWNRNKALVQTSSRRTADKGSTTTPPAATTRATTTADTWRQRGAEQDRQPPPWERAGKAHRRRRVSRTEPASSLRKRARPSAVRPLAGGVLRLDSSLWLKPFETLRSARVCPLDTLRPP